MLKVYGSELCPDCVACKAAFDENNVAYDFINITTSMRNLKEFLKLRDNDPVFDDARWSDDGTLTLDWEAYLHEAGLSKSDSIKTGAACRIDGTGC